MSRAAIVLLLIAAWAASALAQGSPVAADIQLQRAYTDRLITLEDTAAAHVDLAHWCQACGLPDRALVHWREALARDAENAEARAALGYVRSGMEWVPAGEARAAPEIVVRVTDVGDPRDAGLLARRAEFRRRIGELAGDHLPSTDPHRREAAAAEIRRMTDPAAAEPIATLLATGTTETRRLACEVLGKIPGQEAARLLGRYVLCDESEEVRAAAAAALRAREDRYAMPQLLAALKGADRARQRAAYALGELGDRRAVPALISRLNRTEQRIYEAPRDRSTPWVGNGVYIAVGAVTTYIRDLEPVVAEAAVGWNPTVGAIPTGAVLDIRNVSVSIYRTIITVRVPQPACLDALRQISGGADFGYDAQAWQDWYAASGAGGRAAAE